MALILFAPGSDPARVAAAAARHERRLWQARVEGMSAGSIQRAIVDAAEGLSGSRDPDFLIDRLTDRFGLDHRFSAGPPSAARCSTVAPGSSLIEVDEALTSPEVRRAILAEVAQISMFGPTPRRPQVICWNSELESAANDAFSLAFLAPSHEIDEVFACGLCEETVAEIFGLDVDGLQRRVDDLLCLQEGPDSDPVTDAGMEEFERQLCAIFASALNDEKDADPSSV